MFTILEKLGLVCIIILAINLLKKLFKFLYVNFIGPGLGIHAVNFKETGKWAVITGSTDGIGKAYAQFLAKKGLNIVLISRSQHKLETVAADITSTYNVETKIIAADFTKLDPIYHDIEKQLSGLEIGVLVNNVGMSYVYPEYFLDVKNKDKFYINMINCNIFSVTNMCQIIMPQMVERKKGVIINISSTSADIPSPMLSVYSATKAFVKKFSCDLSAEYSKFGLTIQSLQPGYVATNMSKIRKSTWMAPSPKIYVKNAAKTLGLSESTTGYYPHSILNFVVHSVDAVSSNLSRWVIIRTMQNIKGRALRRVIE